MKTFLNFLLCSTENYKKYTQKVVFQSKNVVEKSVLMIIRICFLQQKAGNKSYNLVFISVKSEHY